MINAANQMAAMSAAMRRLLASDRLAKPRNLLIAAADGVTEGIAAMMMSHAREGRSTFLAIFQVERDAALLERVLIVDGSTKKSEINVLCGKFVQKADGSFAILSANRAQPYEYYFGRGGRRLERRPVGDDSNRAVMEMRGLQALMAKAATPACRAEARTATMSSC
jgi:hypothetical protein